MVYSPDPVRLGPDVLMASAVLRLDISEDGKTPEIYIHEDTAHAAVGVSKAYVLDDNVRVVSSKPGPVLTAFAVPDETIGVKKALSMGISGGGPGSDIWFYSHPLQRRLLLNNINDYKLVAHTYSNIWFQIMWYVPERSQG